MSTATLLFMGLDEPETFRARIYVGDDTQDQHRRGFMAALANDGVLECDAYDVWIEALDGRGWVKSEMVPHPEVDGAKARKWTLNDVGRAEWKRIQEEER